MLECNLAVITVEIHSVVCERIAVSGQSVVCSACIVASALTSIFAQEHATGINHFLCKFLEVVGANHKMLRRISVAKCHRLFLVVHHDNL